MHLVCKNIITEKLDHSRFNKKYLESGIFHKMVFQLCQIMYQCCLFQHTKIFLQSVLQSRTRSQYSLVPQFFCRCCSACETVNRGGAASTGSGCASPPGVRASEPAADSRLELQPGRHQPANLPNPHLSSDDQPLFPFKA